MVTLLSIKNAHYRPLAKQKTPDLIKAKSGIIHYVNEITKSDDVHQDRPTGHVSSYERSFGLPNFLSPICTHNLRQAFGLRINTIDAVWPKDVPFGGFPNLVAHKGSNPQTTLRGGSRRKRFLYISAKTR
jgi:hypothetical protein